MFIHFGMKTYYPSSDHMGYGKEDPQKFNPALFDAKQWVAAAKAGGFEGIVLVTKHHDGFCNWPTDTTDHSVKSSPWKEGKGDIVGELIEACHDAGLTFGLYVSIIDKHFEQVGAPGYDTYSDFYLAQLKEISTRYGPVEEYWFDGYKSKQTKIDYQKLSQLIRQTQPNAVVYDSGTLVKYLPERCLRWPTAHGGVGPDQNYRQEVEGVLRWYPNEPSVILQGNWFYHGKPIISLDAMKNYYLRTVGYGVTPLLNIAPNQSGVIDEATVERLKEFKAWVDRLHANDLAQAPQVKIAAESIRGQSAKYGPHQANDGNPETYYATDDDVTEATLEIYLGQVQKVDGFILKEYIPLGQRVEAYSLECWVEGNAEGAGEWVEFFAGKKIGYQRIILEGKLSGKTFPETNRVRLNIKQSLACPLIGTFQVVGSMDQE